MIFFCVFLLVGVEQLKSISKYDRNSIFENGRNREYWLAFGSCGIQENVWIVWNEGGDKEMTFSLQFNISIYAFHDDNCVVR